MRQPKSVGSWWASSERISSHSFVHFLEPSDQGPPQPASPHRSRSTTNRFPLISTVLTIEYERLPIRASTVAFLALIRVDCLEPASEETVLVGLDDLFVPEFVTVEDVLGKGQRTDKKNKKAKVKVRRLGSD